MSGLIFTTLSCFQVVEPEELLALGVSHPHTSHCMANGDVLISTMGDEKEDGKGKTGDTLEQVCPLCGGTGMGAEGERVQKPGIEVLRYTAFAISLRHHKGNELLSVISRVLLRTSLVQFA